MKIVIIGYGCVGKAFLACLEEFEILDLKNIIVIDKDDYKIEGIKFIKKEITKDNHISFFNNLKLNDYDFIIDCAYYICTTCMLMYCYQKNIHYINGSTEHWGNKYKNVGKITVADDARIYERNKKTMKDGVTCFTNFMANPGIVEIFVKMALDKMDASNKSYPEKARDMKLRHVVISEYDTQEEFKKEEDKWRGTWSIQGLFEEGIEAKSECGYGTHETKNIKGSYIDNSNGVRMLILPKVGCKTDVHGYCYDKKIKGHLIQHFETYNICKALKTKDYQPSCYYCYKYCDATEESVKKLWKNIENQKILVWDNSDGYDILGITLICEDYCYWIGSVMNSEDAHDLVDSPYVSPTNMQVCGGLFCALNYCLLHKNDGLMCASDFTKEDIKECFDSDFFGEIIFKKINKNEFEYDKNIQLFDFV